MLNVDVFLLFEKGGVDEREPKNICLITVLFCFLMNLHLPSTTK